MEIVHPINLFSFFGLLIDFIGVLFLIWFGLPSKIEPISGSHIVDAIKDEDVIRIENNNKKIRRGANIGLWLVILGFFLQILGTIIKMNY
jgi:hypothetical protein